jgi:hypothetical protein
MALPIAPLPSMPTLNLSGGGYDNRNRLRDQVLAQIGGQLLGGLLNNAVTHATGGDQTGVAVQEGLIPEQNRNFIQRLLGPQMSTEELSNLRSDKLNQERTAIEAINAADAPKRQFQAAKLERAQQDELAAQGQLSDLVTRRATREQNQQQFDASEKRAGEQFQLGYGLDKTRTDAQVAAELARQRQADEGLGLERQRTEAAVRASNAAAAENEVQTQLYQGQLDMQKQAALEGFINKIISMTPGADSPEQQAIVRARVEEYLATDPTPTSAEYQKYGIPEPVKPLAPVPVPGMGFVTEGSDAQALIRAQLEQALGATPRRDPNKLRY